MLRPFTMFGSLLILSASLHAQLLDGTWHEVKASVKSLDITPAEGKGETDTIAKGSFKSAKRGVYVLANDDGDGGYDLDLWISTDEGATWTEYNGAGNIGPLINDEKAGDKKQFAEFFLNITTTPDPTPTEGDAEGISIGGIVSAKIKSEMGDGTEAVDEVQTLTGTATDGSFDLEFDGQTIDDLDATSDAAAVQAALEGLSNIEVGDVTVTGGPFPADIVVTFGGLLAGMDVADMVVSDDMSTAGDIANAETTKGAEATEGMETVKSASFKLQKQGAVSDSFDGNDIGTPKASLKYVPEDKLPEGLLPSKDK